MPVVRNLLIRAGADFSGAKNSMQRFKKDMGDFKANVASSMKGVQAAVAAAAVGIGLVMAKGINGAVQEAIKFEAALGQVNRMMGANAKSFTDWANNNAAAFGLSRNEAIKFGATYSNLISNFAKDTKETAQYTETLLKTSAIVASARGEEIENVMDRIRSGMLGETDAIEDLGININQSMIKSTDAFKKFAGDKSWDKLTFQTQQQIIYFAILEQATKKYGDSLANNTATAQGQFITQLKDARLSLGQAFLPIYNAVLPALTQMATALANAANMVAHFMNALFGVKQQTQATAQQTKAVNGLGDAYEEAGDKASGALAGFDEVNTLAKSAGSGTTPNVSGTSASNAVNPGADEKSIVPDWLKSMSGTLEKVRSALSGVKEQAGKLWDTIKNLAPWDELFKKLTEIQLIKWAGGLRVDEGIIQSLNGVLQILKGIVTLDFSKILEGVKNLGEGLWKIITGVVQTLTGVDIEKALGDLKKSFADTWMKIKQDVEELFPGISKAVMDGWRELTNWEAWSDVKKKISQGWTDIQNGVGAAWQGIRDAIKKAWGKLFDGTEITWDELKVTLSTLWTDIETAVGPAWTKIRDGISKVWDGIKDGTSIVWNALTTTLSGVWEAIKTGAEQKWEEIKTTVNDKWKTFTDGSSIAWKSINNILSGAWGEIATMAGTKWEDIKQALKKKWDEFTDGKSIDWESIRTTVGKMWDNLKIDTAKVWGGIETTVKNSVNAVIELINKFVRAYNGIKITMPSVGGIGGGTIGVPQIPEIPKLAKGGLAFGPTLAMVGDNPGAAIDPEVVSPVSDLKSMLMDSIQSAVATAVMTAMQMNTGQQVTVNPNIYLDGTLLSRQSYQYNQAESKRIGGSMITVT
ncbi:phage tail protein [Paenibacillus sedimenti]|uniref:Apolipoprotein A1/A4/E family protein n=1 Tax=Paenibacillus sedimenti TaxID=2770274 RepID=A0A926QKA5_9BACL|nr:apolipoprotein A1/A4/E family protein [Paenibacillus sedimenti]MBD0381282.1 apolipoprotein A1/A4/E family protein [Paenibacillus sedimenti]